MFRAIVTSCLLIVTVSASADMVFFENNSMLNPVNDTFTGLTEVGFAFTPISTVDLSGFRTKFFSSDGRSVSFQLFNSIAGVPNTAVTLVNESFTALGGGVLTGVDFAPFTLVGGTEYFLALSNLNGLGFNVTGDPGAQQVERGEVRFTASGEVVRFQNVNSDPPNTQPIFQLLAPTPAAVPEPSTTILLGLCGVVGGGLRWRRRRLAAAA